MSNDEIEVPSIVVINPPTSASLPSNPIRYEKADANDQPGRVIARQIDEASNESL